MEYTQIHKEKPEDDNMELVGLGNTRVLTDYAQKLAHTLKWGSGYWSY